jgi:hypothetical protein
MVVGFGRAIAIAARGEATAESWSVADASKRIGWPLS